MKGKLRITTYKAGTKEIIRQTDWFSNLIVLNSTGNGNGMNLFIKRLIGDTTTDLVITSASIGDDDTAPTDADTDLVSPILEDIEVVISEETGDDEATFQFFIPDAELDDGDYKEFGLFCGTQLFARSIITPTYTKSPLEDTRIDYIITITN